MIERSGNSPLSTNASHTLLVRKLRVYDDVSEAELATLAQALSEVRAFEAGQDLVSIGDRATRSTILLEGWSARAKTLSDGSRQITSLHVPGDFIDLHSFMLHKMDHSVVALTDCRVARLPHANLRAITEREPHLTRLLWLNTVVDAAIHRNWIVSMGRLSAASRLAQLLCELYLRLHAVELAQDYEFKFPLTQPVVADALGMSLVQVSRALRELREQNLVEWRSATAKIMDWDRLAAFAQFDPTYLSLMHEPR